MNKSVTPSNSATPRVPLTQVTPAEALQPGLYLVATPIGNLREISARAIDLLSRVHLVLCEDTRHSRKLFQYYGLHPKLKSCHKFNEQAEMSKVLDMFAQGESVALISDAGAPGIADPGVRLVQACHQQGHAVIPVSGPSAVINAIIASGLAQQGFVFVGFPPAKSLARRKWLHDHLGGKLPFVVFEAPHRIAHFIDELAELVPSTHTLCVARELTKQFEEIRVATIAEHKTRFANHATPAKGEFSLVIDPLSQDEGTKSLSIETDLTTMAELLIQHDISKAAVSAILAKLSGLSKRHCYQSLIARDV